MPAIRYRAYGFVCCVTLYDVPDVGDVAYVKHKLKPSSSPTSSPVRFMGYICKKGARTLSWARPGKLIASAVTNGDGLCSEWRELKKDQHVLAMIVQIDTDTFGAFAVVDQDCWPIVRSETAPLLTLVTTPKKGKIIAMR